MRRARVTADTASYGHFYCASLGESLTSFILRWYSIYTYRACQSHVLVGMYIYRHIWKLPHPPFETRCLMLTAPTCSYFVRIHWKLKSVTGDSHGWASTPTPSSWSWTINWCFLLLQMKLIKGWGWQALLLALSQHIYCKAINITNITNRICDTERFQLI